MCSDSPQVDPMVGQAAAANAAISKEMLDWYKAKDLEDKPVRDEARQMAMDQARAQIATAKKQEGYADDTRAYELSTFRPLEQKIAANAIGYDTAERRDAEAAQSQADVGTAADATRNNITRTVQSLGGDVNSGNFTAGLAGMGARETAMQAAAGNTARKNVEAIGAAKLADAANLGRGIASSNATQTQLGLQAGNSGVNNSQVPGNISAQQGSQMAQGAGLAMQGNSSAGNMMLGQFNAQNSGGGGDDTLATVGKIAGTAAMFMSDKNKKKDVKDAKPEISLAAVRKLPVKSWKYKEGAATGDDGKRRTGPMAQDTRAAMGDKTAPGGKQIDLISMMGHTVNAVKALDKKVTMSLAHGKRTAKA